MVNDTHSLETVEKIRADLSQIASSGTPKLRAFADWLLDNLPIVAFNSIRGLALEAGVNANTVTRISRELGYSGFDAFRADIQSNLTRARTSYEARARALLDRSDSDIFSEVIAATRANTEALFSPEGIAQLDECIDDLLAARRVHAIGVRSCYAIAHYFSYVGAKAFENFVEVPTMPGAILDQLATAGPEDIVVAVSYQHYSAEIARACQIARESGARVLALTDAYNSPIARGAWKVIRLPMAGPQLMPSLNTAFIAVELLLAAMAARSEGAADRMAQFEAKIRAYGGYLDR